MNPKTKQEASRLIEELKAKIGELPDEGRPATEGWKLEGGRYLTRTYSTPPYLTPPTVAEIGPGGIRIMKYTSAALDGIAHDDKGRIKVVGYVNVEDLKERVNRFDLHAKEAVCLIIDKLAG